MRLFDSRCGTNLGANSLVSCVYGGFVAAPSAIDYVERKNAETNGVHAAELKDGRKSRIIKNEGENQYKCDEMGKW